MLEGQIFFIVKGVGLTFERNKTVVGFNSKYVVEFVYAARGINSVEEIELFQFSCS